MSSGDTYEDSEVELQQSSSKKAKLIGQLPHNNHQQQDSRETSSRATGDPKQTSSGNNNGRFKATGDPKQLSPDNNNHQQSDQQWTPSEATLDRKKAEREWEAHSRDLSPSEERSTSVLPDSQVLDEWVRVNAELTQQPTRHWIKSLFILLVARYLSGRRKAIPSWVQGIEDWERVQAEWTRQRLIHWVLALFIAWVALGLFVFVLHGIIWLLVATPVLAFPFRKAIRYYFTKSKDSAKSEKPPKPWWKFWGSR